MTGVRYGEGAGSEQHKVYQTSAVAAERLRAYTSEKVAVVRVFDYKVERRKKEEHEDCLRLLNITGGSPGVMRN